LKPIWKRAGSIEHKNKGEKQMKKEWMIFLMTVTAIASGWAVTQKRYAEIDSNGDGIVSRDEYLQSRLEAFARMDVNADGKLSADEFKMPKAITRGDKDGDGQLNRDEFRALDEQTLARTDKDGDGFLSFAELEN
jgi:hypothetical protein